MAPFRQDLESIVPADLCTLLDQRDGAALLIPKLRAGIDPIAQETVWDHCALYYSSQGRYYEALSIYHALYDALMARQEALDSKTRVHKGTPLVRIADAYSNMGYPVMAKRYMMLTMCEDAVSLAGNIPPETTGTYFRLVWQYGIPHDQLGRYAKRVWEVALSNPKESRFPEWILQELDQDWMTEYTSPKEAATFIANTTYMKFLLAELGSGDGKALERFAHYVLSCVPGFRARMRVRSKATDYDVLGAVEGPSFDFRAELGRYFLCECKDWKNPADVTTVVKFAAVLRSAKCRFGIILSRNGITGEDRMAYAERELLKIFQHDDLTILVLSEDELQKVAEGANFLVLLRTMYERTRLDLPKTGGAVN